MAEEASDEKCAFEVLFRGNFPHILEKIFFSLDYASFESCPQVSQAWRDLFRSESFQTYRSTTMNEVRASEKKLLEAAGNGFFTEVCELLLAGVYPNCRDFPDMDTPLSNAARYGYRCIVRLLIDAGANPNKADRDGIAWLLNLQPTQGHDDLVTLLMSAGSGHYRGTNMGNILVHYAKRYGEKEMVNLILRAGGDPNKVHMDGKPPIIWAAHNMDPHCFMTEMRLIIGFCYKI